MNESSFRDRASSPATVDIGTAPSSLSPGEIATRLLGAFPNFSFVSDGPLSSSSSPIRITEKLPDAFFALIISSSSRKRSFSIFPPPIIFFIFQPKSESMRSTPWMEVITIRRTFVWTDFSSVAIVSSVMPPSPPTASVMTTTAEASSKAAGNISDLKGTTSTSSPKSALKPVGTSAVTVQFFSTPASAVTTILPRVVPAPATTMVPL
mmetsp:Transcript_10804/g.20191  ORF Transcript_10804/g.20191 Transcript_10804/m.20191 type:complete len:208 (-) Transcript_10804:756-1379(-)